jgi:hypothetical protein
MFANLSPMLRRVGILRYDVLARIWPRHPGQQPLLSGEIVVVKDGPIEKWACFDCPGGCGERLSLSLNRDRRPSWRVTVDWLSRPTITPSVQQLNACGCHFWVKSGSIEWCKNGRPKQLMRR